MKQFTVPEATLVTQSASGERQKVPEIESRIKEIKEQPNKMILLTALIIVDHMVGNNKYGESQCRTILHLCADQLLPHARTASFDQILQVGPLFFFHHCIWATPQLAQHFLFHSRAAVSSPKRRRKEWGQRASCILSIPLCLQRWRVRSYFAQSGTVRLGFSFLWCSVPFVLPKPK